MSNKQYFFTQFFKNYVLYWLPAKKIHKAGRASGGCLFGFKKEVQKYLNLKFINYQNQIMLSCNLNNKQFYFIPKYLNCTSWKYEFECFESMLNDFNPSNFCIVGDLNCRIGVEQVVDKNELSNLNFNYRRSSMDKTVNWQGKRLLDAVENIGGIVLNGRSVEDAEGNYTFCGVMGSSVIDYGIGSYSFLQYVTKFSVASKPFSDHMPLVIEIKIPKNTESVVENETLNKLFWSDKNCNLYRNNLSLASINQPLKVNCSVDELLSSLTSKIKSAHIKPSKKSVFTPKQKWFDWKCFRLRSTMLKNLKNFRKDHSSRNRFIFISSKTKFLAVCKQKKLDFQNNDIARLNIVKSSKDWWKISNSLKSRVSSSSNCLSCESLYNHFNSMLSVVNNHYISWCMPFNFDSFLDSPFEQIELVSVLKSLNNNKSPGMDGIPFEFYKFAPIEFVNEILLVFNKIFLTETIPSSFKKSILIPLFKKGDPNIASNYRGLSLIDSICKIFNSVLLRRIEHWLIRYNILNEFQAGFRKQYSTIDNIFNLVNIVTLNNVKSKHTYAFFVDFSCAFDKIPRNSLFYKLSSSGLSSKIVRILQCLYDNTVSRVWDGTMLSDELVVNSGVKQGCILSPVLFSLYLNDLPSVLPGGVDIDGITVKILLYADDIVLLCDSAIGLQKMIDVLYGYCQKWSLSVNLSKSKVLIFRRSPRISQTLRWNYGLEDIEIVNSYRYLGVDINYNLSFKKHLENKLSASKIAINATWSKYISNPKISFVNKLKIFEAASQSILLYAAQVWGYQRHDVVEKLLRFFIKKIHYLPQNTPNYMIYLETGLVSVFITTLKLHFDYINRVLSLGTDRLPRKLAEKIIEHNISWAKEWHNICNVINFESPNNNLYICYFANEILEQIRIYEYRNYKSNAYNSQFHDLYSKLEYNVSSLLVDFSPRASSLIIRARGGLLNINGRAFRNNTDGNCTICNMCESENVFHLIGICPVFNNYRKIYFGNFQLNLNDVIDLLNGKCFKLLYLYLESCLKYRQLIISEYET